MEGWEAVVSAEEETTWLRITFLGWEKVFSEFRIYFSGENLWYTSPMKKYCKTIDPESAAALTQAITYGFSKSFTFGLTATF